MLDVDILNQLSGASIEERIAVIELLLQSLKSELIQNCESHTEPANSPHRPAFGFMKSTGSIHGDVVSPAVPESDWEVLQGVAISPDTQKTLDCLRKVAADTLERKCRLGHYAVIWRDGKPVLIGDDAPNDTTQNDDVIG
ncbi:MAG: hypothetical protein ACOYM4_04330 [Nodosilinea sp.]|jgi:hypothetical protein